jgi:hypothetical protein
MEDTAELERKHRERAALFEEATRIVKVAEAQSRLLSAQDDARVLELMPSLRRLEEEIGHLKRHREANPII